jgi:predicted dehydrogenase
MKAALWLRPRVIVIEKPLGTTLAQAQAVASRTRGTEAAVRVNFQRRFDPRFIAARAEFPGTPRSIVFRYGKGLFNYGSHMVDLLIDWFGAIDYVQAIGFERHSGPDPSISFVCRMAAGFDATLVGFSGTDYDLFEGEIYFVDRMLSFSAGGAKWTRLTAVDSLYYPGYAHLAETGDRKAVASAGGLQELYSAISAFLLDRKPLAGCDIQSAVAGMVVLDAACRSARQGGAPISVATADRALSDHMG